MRSNHNYLTIMVGLPQSGKSSTARDLGHPIVNRDSIRKSICGDMRDHTQEGFVTKVERLMVMSLFNAGHNEVIVDSCNHTHRGRKQWVKFAVEQGYIPYFHNVLTSLETCLTRAARNFPDEPQFQEVIKRMWKKSSTSIGAIPEKQSDNWS